MPSPSDTCKESSSSSSGDAKCGDTGCKCGDDCNCSKGKGDSCGCTETTKE